MGEGETRSEGSWGDKEKEEGNLKRQKWGLKWKGRNESKGDN